MLISILKKREQYLYDKRYEINRYSECFHNTSNHGEKNINGETCRMVFDAAKDICYGLQQIIHGIKLDLMKEHAIKLLNRLYCQCLEPPQGVCSYLAAENYSNVTIQSTEGVSIFVMGDMNPESDPSIAHDITSGSSLKMTNVIKINEYAPQSNWYDW